MRFSRFQSTPRPISNTNVVFWLTWDANEHAELQILQNKTRTMRKYKTDINIREKRNPPITEVEYAGLRTARVRMNSTGRERQTVVGRILRNKRRRESWRMCIQRRQLSTLARCRNDTSIEKHRKESLRPRLSQLMSCSANSANVWTGYKRSMLAV